MNLECYLTLIHTEGICESQLLTLSHSGDMTKVCVVVPCSSVTITMQETKNCYFTILYVFLYEIVVSVFDCDYKAYVKILLTQMPYQKC